MTNSNTIFRKYERFYFLIAVISLALIIWQHFGMKSTLDIYPNPNARISVSSDIINGGKSVGYLNETYKIANMQCQVRSSNTFAHCNLNISIGMNPSTGVDLGQYEQLLLWIDHASYVQDTVRVYLNHSETNLKYSYSIKQKNNLYTILPSSTKSIYKLPLQRFVVPSWWILQNRATTEMAETNLSNVTELSISTGDSRHDRDIDLSLIKAQVVGKWISDKSLYLALLISWIILIFIHACFRLYQLSSQLKLKRMQNIQLTELNKLLHIQKSKFETLAKTDPLTGIANRAGTRDILQRLQNEEGSRCSLINFDIDHFKQINDTYGHEAGDQVLRNLAELVSSQTRTTDHFARWGGEEFIILCPDTEVQLAYSIANDLCNEIAETELFRHRKITCSFGVAEYKMQGKHSVHTLFESADVAMYKAKKAGRNRVELS